jgi:hypothetical protein
MSLQLNFSPTSLGHLCVPIGADIVGHSSAIAIGMCVLLYLLGHMHPPRALGIPGVASAGLKLQIHHKADSKLEIILQGSVAQALCYCSLR